MVKDFKTQKQISIISNKKRAAAEKYLNDNPDAKNKDIQSFIMGKFNGSGLSPHVLSNLRKKLAEKAEKGDIGAEAISEATAETSDMSTDEELSGQLLALVEGMIGPAGMRLVKTITLDLENNELLITPKQDAFRTSFGPKKEPNGNVSTMP